MPLVRAADRCPGPNPKGDRPPIRVRVGVRVRVRVRDIILCAELQEFSGQHRIPQGEEP